MKTRIVVLLSALTLLACPEKKAPVEVHEAVAAKPVSPAAPVKPVQLLIFATGAENGYLLATPDEGKVHGGAAELAARLASDGHCPGPLGDDGSAACADGASLLISTGDNANGQSISSYFKGESTAQVMNQMGYAASAVGNREFDWSREQFLKNAKSGRFSYLAANLSAVDDDAKKLGLQPFKVFERKGIKLAVIGLSSRKATVTPMPGRMAGLNLIADETALNDAVTGARGQGASVLAVTTDGCLNDVADLVVKHPEWKLALVAGRKCDVDFPEKIELTRLVYPGRHFNNYVKATVTVDAAKAGAEQLFGVEAATVEVVSEQGAAKGDEKVAALIAEWKTKLDAALGGQIGFAKEAIEQDSALMSRWLTVALRESFKVDVALLNRKGVRQSVPAGAITKATIYDAIPFENQIVIVKLTGEALLAALSNIEARAAGVKSKDDTFTDDKGKPLDPKREYTVATTDYLYMGGDGFTLNAADKNPRQTNVSWQASLIGWTEKKKSSAAKPLETLLPK